VDINEYNRHAWDSEVDKDNQWTRPVGPGVIAAARRGEWQVVVTPVKPVPADWFPPSLTGVRLLCLAGGGGQQGPILAAAGAEVTVFDNSPKQLAQDRKVAEREGLSLETVQGDMTRLDGIDDESYDLILHPCSNCFVPDIRPVWRECYRVLRPGGVLISGFINPMYFMFEEEELKGGPLQVRYGLPYSDLTSLTQEARRKYIDGLEPLVFGHLLTDQIGGQLEAGFVLTGFLEDTWPEITLSEYTPTMIATRASKPAGSG